ncbi:hypothetical protein R1sor_017441 [Riccia sorocarpa]|uniref:V-SNARE coiled-coil homology domain-containing protein n=1 Tax=Riccia sorocarpa TaxID=122646 RepID=A0ABD3IA81_9MARC
MSYGIPANITLGGLVRPGSHDAPCVVAVLAQPDVYYSRLLIAYGNGLIVLWGLHQNRVLAVRGGTEIQQRELSDYANSLKGRAVATPSSPLSDDEEEKEISCVCWVCPVGSVAAVGYIDGEILLWSLPTIMKPKGQTDMELVHGPPYSGEPLMTVDLAPGKAKTPVVGLTWSASGNSSRGPGGRLYVFGGGEKDRPEALTVVSLDASGTEETGTKLLQLDLQSAFADMVLLPPWPAGDGLYTPAAALALLMNPGLLHVYDELSVAGYFVSLAEGTPSPPPPQPVPLQLPVTETNVTCAKLVFVSNDGVAAKTLLQKPPIFSTSVPSTLPAGTKWPISGGKYVHVGSSSLEDVLEKNLYLTGHANGLISFWDASSPSYNLLCMVKHQSKYGGDRSVTAFEYCASSGLLAVGDEVGMVFVYRMQKENLKAINCHIIGRDTTTLQEEAQQSGETFVPFLILTLHGAAIRSIALSSGLSRLAVGDDNSQVSIVDLQSNTVILYDSCFPHHPSSISSLAFSAEDAPSTSIPQSPPPSSPRITRQHVQGSHVPILYVVGKDANMVAYDGSTGAVLGQGAFHPKNSSTAVSVYLLDAEGTPLSLPGAPGHKPVQTEAEYMESTGDSSEEKNSTVLSTHSEAQYLLLCCTDALRLYGTSLFIQGQRENLKKVKLERTICWTAVFGQKSKEFGLILMYTDGDIEFRSLPDLEYVKATSLRNWKIDLDEQVLRSLGCNTNGRFILIDHGKEVLQLSCLLEDTNRDQHLPQPQLYDSELALADAYASSIRGAPKKKTSGPGMEGLLKGVVSGVIKELKNALDPEVQHVHFASELPKLFATQPFPIPSPSVSSSMKTGGDVSSSDIIDIDDIDFDEVTSAPQAPAETSNSGLGKFMRKVKGKEKASRDPESDRMKLFDGNDASPRQQTVDDIRAKYGHPRKSQEITGVMEMARNKLMERGEKLQGIEDKTSELEDNAANFASLAEELAKKMAARKWWEL